MKNLMINIRINSLFTAFSIAFCTVLSGCSPTASEEIVTEPVNRENVQTNSHLIVFIDKTMSSVTSDQIIKKQVLQLDDLIKEHLKNNGDSFYAYTIHSSTGPGSNFQQIILNLMNNTTTGGERTKMIDFRKHQNQIQQIVIGCSENCKTELTGQNTQDSNQQTDLWATLNLIGKHTSGLPQQDKVTVLYISDMIESMNGQRRDFHKNPISTPAEAKKLASQDLKTIRANYITEMPAFPGNVTVKIWLPYSAHAKNNAANMVTYWEEIFRQLGMKTMPANC